MLVSLSNFEEDGGLVLMMYRIMRSKNRHEDETALAIGSVYVKIRYVTKVTGIKGRLHSGSVLWEV